MWPLIFFDSLRVIAGIASVVTIAVTPYALTRPEMQWSQKLRFIGAALMSVGLVASYVMNFGDVPAVWWRTTLVAVGIIISAVGFVAYVRADRQEEEEEPEVRIVDRLANIPAVFIVADELGRIVTASGMGEEVIGWAPTALMGRPLATIIPAEYLDAHFAGMNRVSAGGQSQIIGQLMDLHVMTRSQIKRPVQLMVLPLEQAHPTDPHRYLGIILSAVE